MFRTSKDTFHKLLHKATSGLQPDPDWKIIVQICNSIRQNDVKAKYAVNAIIEKMYSYDQRVVLSALQVLEACAKNCGSPVHAEISSSTFIEEFRLLVKTSPNENVRTKMLELMQTWAHAFRKEPKYIAVQKIVDLMKNEGYTFPTLEQSDAMFDADEVPKRAEEHCCYRCRIKFSVVQRKRYCKNCSHAFCSKCSSKSASIPRYGIEKEVRVCDSCWDQLNKQPSLRMDAATGSNQLPSNSSTKDDSNGKTEQELQEEEELQLALALSQSEADARAIQVYHPPSSLCKGKHLKEIVSSFERNSGDSMTKRGNNNMEPELAHYPNSSFWEKKGDTTLPITVSRLTPSVPPLTDGTDEAPNTFTTQPPASLDKDEILNEASPSSENSSNKFSKEGGNGNMDSESAHYLNYSVCVKKQDEIPPPAYSEIIPSATPSTAGTSKASNNFTTQKVTQKSQNDDEDKMQEFLSSIQSILEVFVNRMKRNYSRERPLANDAYAQSLFMNISRMHSQLLKYVQEQEDLRAKYEGLQNALYQLSDTRAALNAIREEHMDRRRREAEEAKIQGQLQMAQKLEIMRKHKQEYLQYQTEIALKRIQEQEREMGLRQEQQIQQYQIMKQLPNLSPGSLPPAGVNGPLPRFQPQYVSTAVNPVNYSMSVPALAAYEPPALLQFSSKESFDPSNNALVSYTEQNHQSLNTQTMAGSLPTLQRSCQYPQGKAPVTCAPLLPSLSNSMPFQPPAVIRLPNQISMASVPPVVMSTHLGPNDRVPGAISGQSQLAPNNTGNMYQTIFPTNLPMPPPGTAVPEQYQLPPPTPEELNETPLPNSMPFQPSAVISLPNQISMTSVPPAVMTPHLGPNDRVPGAISGQSQLAPNNTGNMYQTIFPTNLPMPPPGTAVPEQYQLPPPTPEELNETPLPNSMPFQPPAVISLPNQISMASVPPVVMSTHLGPNDRVPGAISGQSQLAPNNTGNMYQTIFPTNLPMPPPGTAVPEQYQLPPPTPEELNETPLITFD